MARILLVRHAEHALLESTLVGRDEGRVHLSEAGRMQAINLARALADESVDCLQSSPRLRCLETAAEIGEAFDLPVIVENALDEIDFGRWTGTTFEELNRDPLWSAWNNCRSRVRPPDGETIVEARVRILRHLEVMRRRHPLRTIAMVTHSEIIRLVKLHEAGLSADFWNIFDVPTASVTEVEPPLRTAAEGVFEALAS